MIPLIIFIILLLILLIFISYIYLYIRNKTRGFLSNYFGTTSLREALDKTELQANNTPKSLSSMENIYLPKLKKDFSSLNINELKAQAESVIRGTFDAIENKDNNAYIKYAKVNSYIKNQINDYKNNEIHFYSIHFHNTVLNRYENSNGIATIYFQSSLEYEKQDGSGRRKKIQTRMRTEFIYIVDENKVSNSKKALGLNCPNCGAPIKGVGERKCLYCGSGIEDIVKRAWTINNIAEF